MRTIRRGAAALVAAAMLMVGLSTVSPVVAQEGPVPLVLENLSPIARSTWGVVGIGATSSQQQQLQVWDFEQIGDRLFVAGSFTDVQEDETSTPISQPYLAAFDVDTGVYIPGFAPVLDRTVYDLTVHNGRLLVGGEFTTVNGLSREGLVALDPITGATDTSMEFWASRPFSTTPSIVRTLELDGDMLYIGGNFNYLNKGTGNARTRAYSVGRVNLGTDKLDATWAPRTSGSGIWDLTVDPGRSRVSFVGFFTAINALPNTALMATVSRLDGTLVAGLTPFTPSAPSQTTTVAITYTNNKLFV